MNNQGAESWTPSLDIEEEILLMQPQSLITLEEFGNSLDNDANNKSKCSPEFGYGYGRGVPAKSSGYPSMKVSAEIKNLADVQTAMGKILTTSDILELNSKDEHNQNAGIETTAMIRNAGIGQYDDADLDTFTPSSSDRSEPAVIYNKNKIPILLHNKFFQFKQAKIQKLKVIKDTPTTEEDVLSSDNVIKDNGATAKHSIIAFEKVLNGSSSRYKEPTIGIGREKLLKPVEIYIRHEKRRNKKVKSES